MTEAERELGSPHEAHLCNCAAHCSGRTACSRRDVHRPHNDHESIAGAYKLGHHHYSNVWRFYEQHAGSTGGWYRKAAEQNDDEAQDNLGTCYANGQGVVQDYLEAVKWYRKAAEQDYSSAQYNLGICYHKGQGVGKDHVEAVKWFRKAAEQDCALAQVTLAACCYDGRGVSEDYVQAYRWWLLAAGHGNEVARKNVAIMEFKMTREQIAAGQNLARNFKPLLPRSGQDKGSPQ